LRMLRPLTRRIFTSSPDALAQPDIGPAILAGLSF
jgi:hypothetical protein